MKTFKLHILPVLLALLIIALGCSLLFFAMHFGFSFQDRIIVRSNPDAGVLSSDEIPPKLTDLYWWQMFEKADKKSLANGVSADDTDDETYKVLSSAEEDVSLLSRYFLGHITVDESDVTVDLSSARYAVVDISETYEIYGEDSYIIRSIVVDGCVVSFDNEGEKYKLRYAYNNMGELIFFEFENLKEKEYTSDDVNSAYKYISSELSYMQSDMDSSRSPYTLLYDQSIIRRITSTYSGIHYDDYVEAVYDDPANFNWRFERPISYFLALYGFTYNPYNTSTAYVKSNLAMYMSTFPAQTVYSDGCIYISCGVIDGKSGVMLKYSVADKCITGVAIN